jgi:ADP-ribosyl-[dinitrogen reductase] hydrolase
MTGAWNRDLGIDLDALRSWGAAAVITLIQAHEFESLGVDDLGQEVIGRHMDWLHLPIQDVSVPGRDFEQAWKEQGERVRARLRNGFNVVVHCKGGLGRAGTVAARLLVELGWEPSKAISAVRQVRPAQSRRADNRITCSGLPLVASMPPAEATKPFAIEPLEH